MGVDFGEVRVGLALSDETRTLASPLPTLARRRGKRPPVQALSDLAREHGATDLVFGLPLELSGEEGSWAAEVRRVARAVGERAGIPVHFVDERLTSVMAERQVRGSGLTRSRREERGRVDAQAAVLILQRWLDAPPPSTPDPDAPR